MTGEHSLVIRLRKHGGGPCVLNGYPRVTLIAKGRRLPFDYANYQEDSDGYVHGPAASRQELRKGASVSFIATKYRCDAGAQATADEILIRLPHVTRPVRVRLPPTDRGVMELSYCTPADGSRTDPGDLVALSALTRHLYDRQPVSLRSTAERATATTGTNDRSAAGTFPSIHDDTLLSLSRAGSRPRPLPAHFRLGR